jgi:hypothetical protein
MRAETNREGRFAAAQRHVELSHGKEKPGSCRNAAMVNTFARVLITPAVGAS